MSKGIDYGLGQTNIDRDSGIRYGVISMHEVGQAWSDDSEGDYGPACCPKCGNEALEITDNSLPDIDELDEDQWTDEGRDFACLECRYSFDSSEAYGDEPLAFTLDDGEYLATQGGDDSDIFITKSPYYTRASFCSPCAPGACYLTSPCDDGEKCYCFGHEFFEDGIAPYPVYRVSDNTLIVASRENVACPNCNGTGTGKLQDIADKRQCPTSTLLDDAELMGRLKALNFDADSGVFNCYRCNGTGQISEIVLK